MSYYDTARMPTAVTEARSRLIVKAVFFSCILYDQSRLVVLMPGDTDWCGIECLTAMTDGLNLVINYDFFAGLSVEERVFVLCHEIYHIMCMHPKRMRKYATEGLFNMAFIPLLYNVAADAAINKTLVESKIGKMPADCVWIERIGSYLVTGMETAEEIYKLLLDQCPPSTRKKLEEMGGSDPGLEGMGRAIAGKAADQKTLGSDVLPNSPDEAAASVNEAQMKAAVVAAATQAKSQGTMPAGLKRFIDDFLEEQITWNEVLRSTIVTRCGTESSDWSRPNRRKIVLPGVYMPRRRGLRAGPMAAAVDTSGSVSAKELAQFMGELSSILGDVRPEVLYLMWCDAQVDAIVELQDPEELKVQVAVGASGGGGTSFIPPFLYLDEHEIYVETVVYLTDMYGPFPSAEQVGNREVIWCASSDVVAPVGTTVRVTF